MQAVPISKLKWSKGLRHFLAPLGAENLSEQGKEVNDQKMPETLVNTGFMLF
jgi:hypothetical protein